MTFVKTAAEAIARAEALEKEVHAAALAEAHKDEEAEVAPASGVTVRGTPEGFLSIAFASTPSENVTKILNAAFFSFKRNGRRGIPGPAWIVRDSERSRAAANRARATYEAELGRDPRELRRQAKIARADARGVVSGDDPDAIAKLRAKLETADSGERGRIQARLELLERAAKLGGKRERIGDAELVWNAAVNRLQVFFAEKPDAPTRTKLKGLKFLWAPSVAPAGAWQRNLKGGRATDVQSFLRERAERLGLSTPEAEAEPGPPAQESSADELAAFKLHGDALADAEQKQEQARSAAVTAEHQRVQEAKAQRRAEQDEVAEKLADLAARGAASTAPPVNPTTVRHDYADHRAERAEAKGAEAEATLERARELAQVSPLGQPIPPVVSSPALVGESKKPARMQATISGDWEPAAEVEEPAPKGVERTTFRAGDVVCPVKAVEFRGTVIGREYERGGAHFVDVRWSNGLPPKNVTGIHSATGIAVERLALARALVHAKPVQASLTTLGGLRLDETNTAQEGLFR